MWITNSFKPVIYALIMAYLLDSAVNFFVRKLKVRRSQGILLACIILIGLLSFIVYKVVPQIVDNINNIVNFIMHGNVDVVEIINNLKGKIDGRYIDFLTDYILQASESVKNTINRLLIDMSNILMRFLRNIGTSTFTVITSFIINIYMLVEKEDILARGRRFIYAYFNEKNSRKILTVFSKSNKIFKSFLNGKLLDSAIVGVICVIAFYLFKVPYAPLMGTIIGFFNMIPFFGPIIGSVPVIIVSFFLDPTKAITALIIIIVIQQLDANILDPRIVGGNVGVSPFWIITSVTVAGNLFGIPGMVLGVPAVVLIKTIIEESVNLRLLEKGMSDIEKENMKK
ncbi:AI-2E family transporter [Sedimentibacter hydroxybenzoicus DSM 7310]|uniref:AI-2E family transporter n=1 Tax=Sedimentibacter hydroxybenzoicus DSM 7310 TaxID=1123245 RepID=A0A974BMR4_SEDHY|nr:AI-2E family transporter [Sedimentibacter hydroxybenzoicus DSM 7310]